MVKAVLTDLDLNNNDILNSNLSGGGGGGDLTITRESYRHSAQFPVTGSATTVVTFDTALGTETLWNKSTGAVLSDGIYYVEYQSQIKNPGVAFNDDIEELRVNLKLNGTTLAISNYESWNNVGFNGPGTRASTIVELTTGDLITFDVFVWDNSLAKTYNLEEASPIEQFTIVKLEGGGTTTGAEVTSNVAQTLSDSTLTALTFDTEGYDTENYFDIGNPTRITIPEDGFYVLSSQISYAVNSTGGRRAQFRINGTTGIGSQFVPAATSQETQLNTAITREFSAGDYVELYGEQTSGGNLDVNFRRVRITKVPGVGSGGGGGGGGTAWTLDNIKHKMLFGLIDGNTTDISNAAITTQTVTNVPSTSLDGTINKTVFNFAATTHLAYNFPLDGAFTYAVFVAKINGADSIRRLANAYTTNNFFNISLDMAGEVTSIVYKPIQDNFPSSTDTFITYDWTGVDESQWRIWIYSLAHGPSKAQVDGSIMNISTTGSSTVDSSPSTYLNINGFLSAPATPDGIGDGSTWDCWAALFFQDIGQSELDKVVGYLAHEAGLTANLPTGHPYKTDVPTHDV